MIISCIRHGQTQMNKDDLVCGRTDIPLTELGMQQAQQAGEDIVKQIQNGLQPIDYVISSPLLRAQQTASIICQKLNLKFNIDQRLIEQCYGDFENKSRFNKEYLQIRSQFALHYPRGESMLDVANRVYSLLDEITQKSFNHVLLVTHGGTIRLINTYFSNMTNEEFASFRALNCQIQSFFSNSN